ncbi:MAG: potassium channel family protein [Pseudomonadota bacterium]|nr:potassium channel family protein [Pseudomonadota bacterium]
MTDEPDHALVAEIDKERASLLQLLQDWLEVPMLVLAFLWLGLFIVEIAWGLTPLLEIAGTIIWVLFIAEFGLGFVLAPRKLRYLRDNWLKGIALAAPAFRLLRIVRLLRIARAARLARGLRLLRLLSSLNRGMRALSTTMGRRGFGYVILLTLIVTLVSAAGMYAFENEAPDGRNFESYGDAVWWTAMIVTTLGSDYWPQTSAGRVLCFFLALYSFAVFGYVTATLATWFIDSDAANKDSELASASAIEDLRSEIAALRRELQNK